MSENIDKSDILEYPVWKLFNIAVLMYLNEEEKPFFDLYVNGRPFKIELDVTALEEVSKILH